MQCNGNQIQIPAMGDPVEENNVRDMGPHRIHRPCWLWTVVALDIIWVNAVLAWTNSHHATEMRQLETGHEDSDQLTFTSILIGATYILQFLMGMMVVIAVASHCDSLLLRFLRAYLIGSWILIVKIVIVVLISVFVTMHTGTYSYENWQRIVTNMISMVLRVPTHLAVQELVKRFSGSGVSLQDLHELELAPRNIGA